MIDPEQQGHFETLAVRYGENGMQVKKVRRYTDKTKRKSQGIQYIVQFKKGTSSSFIVSRSKLFDLTEMLDDACDAIEDGDF